MALSFEGAQCILIDFAIANDLSGKVAFLREHVGSVKGRQITEFLDCGASGRKRPGLNAVYGRLGDSVGVVPNFILITIPIFMNVVRKDFATIFEVDGVRPKSQASLHQ